MTKIESIWGDGFLVDYNPPEYPQVKTFITVKGGTTLKSVIPDIRRLIQKCYDYIEIEAELGDLDRDELPDYIKVVVLGYDDEDTLAVSVYEKPLPEGDTK